MLIENKILPKRISDLYEDLIDSSYQKISLKEKKVIYQSLVIAYNGHDGQMRKSGEPYIHHPCLLYTSPSPRDPSISRMPSSA